MAETHKIRRIFAILLHKIFPITNQEFHHMLEITFTTNSGAEVPNATMVSQITISEIENFLANAEAPSTSRSAHLISNTNHITNKTYVIEYLSF